MSPRVDIETRNKILDEYHKGTPAVDLAKKYNVSASTIYNWSYQYNNKVNPIFDDVEDEAKFKDSVLPEVPEEKLPSIGWVFEATFEVTEEVLRTLVGQYGLRVISIKRI